MRGARSRSGRFRRPLGIIPADAGMIPKGSSPRMRGAQVEPFLQVFQLRIIPADAGSTLLCYL